MSPTLQFIQALPGLTPPLRADRGALGSLPLAAYQYCEAVCTASAHGWYVFPPQDITLRWTGAEVLMRDEQGGWQVLESYTPDDAQAHWDRCVPAAVRGKAPPLLTSLFVAGLVQVWSGLIVRTAPGWSTLVRPLVNLPGSHLFSCYEALVETDRYGPWPLFMNLRLLSTSGDIHISRLKPLFQVQPMPRSAYTAATAETDVAVLGATAGLPPLSDEDWQGYLQTLRPLDPREDERQVGQYAAGVRRRARGE